MTATAAILIAGMAAVSQNSDPADGTLTLHIRTDLVQLPVLALRPPFDPVVGLKREDFSIRLDNGPPFHPRYVHMEGSEPLDLIFIVEANPKKDGSLSSALQAALTNLPPNLFNASDRISLYIYGCRLIETVETAPVSKLSKLVVSPEQFRAAVSGCNFAARPPLTQVVEATLARKHSESSWRVLLMYVDGETKTEPSSIAGVQILAAAANATLFAVKYLPPNSFPVSVYSESDPINNLVSSLGGLSLASSFEDLGPVTAKIISALRKRYILSFPRPINGQLSRHRIDITSRKGVRVRSSAASAPSLDNRVCSAHPDTWFCPEQRPQYGTSIH